MVHKCFVIHAMKSCCVKQGILILKYGFEYIQTCLKHEP